MMVNLDEVEYLTETSLTIRRARRRITVPKEIVDHFGLEDGDHFIWIMFKDGNVKLVPKKVTQKNAIKGSMQ